MSTQKVVLQVPMAKSLRDTAQVAAMDCGFSSLQETVRVILNKLARKQLTLTIEENVEYLTPKQEAVLAQREAEFLRDKAKGETYTARSVNELIKQLES